MIRSISKANMKVKCAEISPGKATLIGAYGNKAWRNPNLRLRIITHGMHSREHLTRIGRPAWGLGRERRDRRCANGDMFQRTSDLWAPGNAANNLRIPYKADSFLNSLMTVSYTRSQVVIM
jgi:hypothetical protein